VLNFMQPQAAGRQRVDFDGEARRNEAGRKSTRTGRHDVDINRQRWPRLEGPSGYDLARINVRRLGLTSEKLRVCEQLNASELTILLPRDKMLVAIISMWIRRRLDLRACSVPAAGGEQ